MGKIRCFGAPNAEAHVLSHLSHSLSDQDKSGRPSGRRYARDRQLAREKQRRKTCVGARKEDVEWPAARTTPPPRARGAVRAAMGTNGHCGTFSGARTAESETSNGLADNSWVSEFWVVTGPGRRVPSQVWGGNWVQRKFHLTSFFFSSFPMPPSNRYRPTLTSILAWMHYRRLKNASEPLSID